jgi:hypothetical protein
MCEACGSTFPDLLAASVTLMVLVVFLVFIVYEQAAGFLNVPPIYLQILSVIL